MTGGDELSDALGALERRDLIRRETISAIEGEQQYAFTHVLIRDVAYDLLPRARAPGAARALRAVPRIVDRGDRRGWRGARAPLARRGRQPRALEYALAAAGQAEQGWAKDRAVTFYREALALLDPGDVERRRHVLRRLAVAQQAYLHVEDARSMLGRDPAG